MNFWELIGPLVSTNHECGLNICSCFYCYDS